MKPLKFGICLLLSTAIIFLWTQTVNAGIIFTAWVSNGDPNWNPVNKSITVGIPPHGETTRGLFEVSVRNNAEVAIKPYGWDTNTPIQGVRPIVLMPSRIQPGEIELVSWWLEVDSTAIPGVYLYNIQMTWEEDVVGGRSETDLNVDPYLTLTSGGTVGGVSVPVDKFGLLAPYVGLTSTIIVATVATAIYVKRVKRRKEKQ